MPEYRVIPNYPNYEISRTGTVRRRKGGRGARVGHELAWNIHESGYAYVNLWHGAKRACKRVHRLVWRAWVGEIPADRQINHLNGDPTDNRLENLECVTASENMQHAYAVLHRRPASRGATHHNAKLTAEDVLAIRALSGLADMSNVDIGTLFDVSDSRVSRIVNRKAWRHV